jgi:hypothetical protein
MNSHVREALSWVKTLMESQSARRPEWVKAVLKGIRSYNSMTGEPTAEGKKFADYLASSSEFELIGICPNIMYIKTHGNEEDQKAMWLHAWGTPVLLYKHRKTCALVIAGPGIRFNDSVVREISYNQYKEEILGITG